MKTKKFNRDVKRKFLLFDILNRIDRGATPYEIAKAYGWDRRRLGYWTKQMRQAQLIKLKYRTSFAVYELTPRGKNFYTECVEVFQKGIRLHNISYSYEILNEGSLAPEKKWQINGLSNKLKREKDASIVWNHKTLTINVASLIGDNAYELVDKAKNIADNIAKVLDEQHGFKLGQGRQSRRPHFAVINKLIEKISKNIQFSSEDAKIDESEGAGEIEFFEPHKVQQFVEMPEKVSKLEDVIENKLTPALEKVAERDQWLAKNLTTHENVLNNMQATMKGIQTAITELTEVVKELRKK